MKFALTVILATVLQCGLSHNSTSQYKPLTPEQAARLSSWTTESDVPMWLLSGQTEGDMILPPEARNGLIDNAYRWPGRTIPYVLSNDFTDNQKQFIFDTLNAEYAKTCIRVVPRTNQADYVYVTGADTGCWSEVGRRGGQQALNLQPDGCLWYGTITHEFLHAAGFYHQQSDSDRDNWVWVLWDNIIEDEKHNFNRYPDTLVTSFGERYDYESIMHYPRKAFTKNGLDTLVPKDPNAQIGQNNGLSAIDIRKVATMYGC